MGWIDRQARLLAVAIFLVNVALRLPGVEAQGLWFDEAISIAGAAQPIDLGRRLAADASPPLYGLLLTPWMRAFGVSLAGARSLSVVLSSATAALVFAFGRRFLGPGAGLAAAALFSTSRVQLYFAEEARPYALVGLLCVASFYLLAAQLRSPSRCGAAGLALLNAALLYAHYVAGLALVAELVAAALASVPAAEPRAARHRPALTAYVASFVASAVLFAPLAVYLAWHWPPPMSGWAEPATPGRLAGAFASFAGSPLLLAADAAVLLVVLLARRRATTTATGSAARAAEPGMAALLCLWAFLPPILAYAVSQVVPIFLSRYLLYASIGLYLLVGWAVSLLPARVSARAAIVGGLCALSLAAAWREPDRRPDWRGAAAIVREASVPGSLAVVAPPHQVLPFAFHFSPEAFRDPGRMLERLAAERVVAVELPAALGDVIALEPRRLILAVSEELAPVPPEIVPRLAGAGYALVERRPRERVVVLVFDRRA